MHNQFGFHIQILIQKLLYFEFIVKELKKKEKKERCFLALRALKER